MESLQARLDSFKNSKRVKNPNKPSSMKTLKWPHSSKFKADPESLAEAGFFYDPSYDDPDNVTCFRCGKQLGGWEDEDDPYLIHWEKCGQTCCWAIVQCGLTVDMDKSGMFVFPDKTRLPNHKSMEKARLETFTIGKGWVHDNTKNHGASSKSMARAGFVYTPQESGDDLATCFYCNVSLSGWDEDDDPMEEHRKRAIKASTSCPFIEHTDLQTTKPPSRAASQSTKPPSKSKSKPPSRSTSRTKHQDVVMPTKTFNGEDESDAPMPRSRSASRKSSAKTPKRKKRSTSRSSLKDVAEEAEDEQTVEAPPTKKMTRSRSKSVARPEVTLQPDDKGEVSPSRKPSRSRAKSKAPVQEEPEGEEPPRKSSRSKSKALPEVTAGTSAKSHRPSRKSSKPRPAEQVEEEEVQHKATAKPTKTTKHKRMVSRSKSKAPPTEEDSESDPVMITTTTAKKSTIIGKAKGQPQSRPQNPEAKDLFDEDIVMNNYIPPPSSPPSAPQPLTMELPPLFIPKRTTKKKQNTPKPVASEGSEVTITATPDKENEQRKSVRSPKAKPESTSLQEEDEGAEMMTSSKPSQSGRETSQKPKQTTKVVEVSSDEDIDEFPTRPTEGEGKTEVSRGLPTGNATQSLDSDQVGQVLRPQDVMEAELDVSTDNAQQAEPEAPDVERYHAPSTPPRSSKSTFLHTAEPKDTPSPSHPLSDLSEKPSVLVEPDFVPPLSRLPFMPLLTLSEAELDMTVEDWIRYHIEVEQDRFKRDGERELERFKEKAEEVRTAIESL